MKPLAAVLSVTIVSGCISGVQRDFITRTDEFFSALALGMSKYEVGQISSEVFGPRIPHEFSSLGPDGQVTQRVAAVPEQLFPGSLDWIDLASTCQLPSRCLPENLGELAEEWEAQNRPIQVFQAATTPIDMYKSFGGYVLVVFDEKEQLIGAVNDLRW